ncbi:thioredoxin family protein [Tenacibaculum maritimum]|uniref:thioredoxin family protein n=1 Tax=Tenacibaculum maritimum TaxID=107401 RepID=UPI0003F7E307|nr:thioredoxin family protein [Tenacibaculum maritimum]
MKKVFHLLLSLVITSCVATKNKVAIKNQDGDLVGIATRNDFKKEPFASQWFNDYYEYYQTDPETVTQLKQKLNGITIKGFMGTWCGDSQREIPNFYKLLDESDFDFKKLELVTVNRKKQANGLEKGYNITHVPTFIFYKEGKELGRFVEHANENGTIEGDILKIVSGIPYKHPYQK